MPIPAYDYLEGDINLLERSRLKELTPTEVAVRTCVANPDSDPVPVNIVSGSGGSSETPKIYNVSTPLADTEYSQSFTDNTKRFTIRVRGKAGLKIAFNTGESGTNYLTIPMGSSYTVDGLLLTSKTIYFQVSKDSQTVEIMEWV